MSATDISTSSDLSNNLDGHIALVTGASSGLGAHFAHVLASAGARVIIAARRMDRLQLLATQLNDALDSDEPQIMCHALDVNALDKIPEFFAHLAQAEIMPDILINNAGMNIAKSALDMQPEDVNMIMSTNMIAPFFMATEFARHHIAAKQSARIINIASVGATHVLPSLTPYCMSKAGIMMMTRGLAREWARFDINVNALDKIPEFFADLAQAEIMPDILINNAGMNIAKSALDMQPEDVNMIMSTNMIAPFFMATEFARHHIAAKQSARIINIASVGATHVLPSLTPYCMSKAGIMMMTRGLAREWARFDINVNAICPGYIETEINDFWWKSEGGQKQIARFPRRRLGEMSDLDGVLLLLAGEQGKGINGSSFTVDDGQYI